jgi:hypothetical protein
MKCDGCGCQFSAREAQAATRNMLTGQPGRHPYTTTVATTLCPGCVASRAVTLRFIVWTIVLALIGAMLLAVVFGR